MAESGKPYVITIVGPESSGKSSLTSSLSDLLGCPAVPEYARTYLDQLPDPYTIEDLEEIAKGQIDALRTEMADADISIDPDMFDTVMIHHESHLWKFRESDSVLFFSKQPFGNRARKVILEDSGLLSIRMWAEIKYGATLDVVEEGLAADTTDMYILCRPVFPWVPDPLREARSLVERVWIYNHFLKYLVRWPRRSTAM